MKTQLTRREKEKLFVDLYNQKKTYAQIAKEDQHIGMESWKSYWIGPINEWY